MSDVVLDGQLLQEEPGPGFRRDGDELGMGKTRLRLWWRCWYI